MLHTLCAKKLASVSARKLVNYPPEFADAFRRAQQGECVVLRCDNPDEAIKLRTRLYHYRHALFEDPEFDLLAALAASDLRFEINDSTVTILRRG